MARLKVASLIPSLHFGGDEKRLLVFGAALDRSRFAHEVLLLRPPEAAEDAVRGDMRPLFDAAQIPVRALGAGDASRGSGPARLARGWALTRRLAELLRRGAIDIVDARMNQAIAVGVAAARLAGRGVVVGTTYRHHTLRGPVKYPLGQATVLGLDALVSDARATIDAYQDWLLRRHPRALVIPNGVPPPRAEQPPKVVRRRFGLPEDPGTLVIGQVSRLMPFKGQRVLIEAAAPLLRERPELYLLLCGHAVDPAYPQMLWACARELSVADKVRIGGYPGLIGDVWGVIDIHAHPTLQDSSPIAIIEAMSLGRPTLASDVGGISELIAHEVSGLVIPRNDVAACRAGLRRLVEDPRLRGRLGEGARRRYLETHTPQRMTRAIETLFADLAAVPGS